ncbi:MAG: hypothetical protein IPP78_06985 [Holophagaceae bacterium]|nr:hypothetical protein [Holophagaceae bacterium]
MAPHFTSAPPTSGLVGLALSYTPITDLDPEGDTITITKTAGPGTFSGGVLTYTPVLADVAANPTFTFSANDGHGGVTVQTFTLPVVSNNTKPNITTATIPDVHLNHNISLQLTATDDGVGGSALTWTLVSPVAGFSPVLRRVVDVEFQHTGPAHTDRASDGCGVDCGMKRPSPAASWLIASRTSRRRRTPRR